MYCSGCKRVFDAGSNSCGSLCRPAARCPYCGTMHEFGDGRDALDRMIESADGIRLGAEGIKLRYRPERTIEEQLHDLRVAEYWIQGYVREKYRKLGFASIEGPFDAGPDFKVSTASGDTFVEVEVRCENYLQHKHHCDPRFNAVGILIVLEPEEPPQEVRKALPSQLVHLDLQDFTRWYCDAAKKHAAQKERERPSQIAAARLRLRASRFQGRPPVVCADAERDMTTCPECDLCPYFDEGLDDA